MTKQTIQVRLNVAIVLGIAAIGLAIGCSVMSYGAAVSRAEQRIAVIEQRAEEREQVFEADKKYNDTAIKQLIDSMIQDTGRLARYTDQLEQKYNIVLTEK